MRTIRHIRRLEAEGKSGGPPSSVVERVIPAKLEHPQGRPFNPGGGQTFFPPLLRLA